MEALLVIAAVVALVWGGVIFLRGGLLGGCLAVLIAGCLFGHAFFHLPTEPVPLTADRVLWLMLLVQCVVWRRFGLAEARPWGKADLILAAFVVVLVVSTVTHDWQAHGARPAAWLMFFYVMPVGMYWVARQANLTERGLLVAWAVLGGLGVYLAVTALAETRQAWWLVYPKFIASPDHAEFFGRARGPFLNPVGCGFFQGVCLCAALMWWPRLNRPGRLALIAAGLLICLGAYSTYTRSAWMGVGLGLLILAAVALPRSWRVPVLGGAMVVVALAATTQWDRLVAFRRDKGLSAQETAASVHLRPILARVAWNMFCDRPLFGCGFGQYVDHNIYYLADRSTDLPLEKARPYVQHSVVLSLLTETGLVGTGLFVAMLLVWGLDARRLWQTAAAPPWARRQGLLFLAVLGVYLPNAVFHEVSLIPMANMLLFFMAGVTAGLRPSPRSNQWPTRARNTNEDAEFAPLAEASGTTPRSRAPAANGGTQSVRPGVASPSTSDRRSPESRERGASGSASSARSSPSAVAGKTPPDVPPRVQERPPGGSR